ncbi:MAG: glycosyltransferase family 4 protein [Thermodesulfobacteriota bacterium]
MKIAHIWKDEYPWDVRVEKISKALIDAGHEVHLICKNNGQQKTEEKINGIHIHRLWPCRPFFLNHLVSVVAFFNPTWIYKIIQIANKTKIDVLLVRDLPLAITALWVGKYLNLPVIFDMAENYPSMWREHVDKRGLKFINHFVKNPTVAAIMENYAVRRVDHTIVVVEESQERIIKKGVPKNKLSIVSNTPDLALCNFTPTSPDPYADKFKLVYVGSINGGRGLDTVIKAISSIKKQIHNFHLIIAGDGEYLAELKKLSENLGVKQDVSFLGWVDPKQVPPLIYHSDICTVPHVVTEFINSTIPNKIFDYMAYGKPLIVSDAKPLRRIVEEAGAGVIFRSGDADDFAVKTLQLQDKERRKLLGAAGLEAVKKKYNWQYDMKILNQIFVKIANSSSGSMN